MNDLTKIFGVNCFQDGQVLVIRKSDLPFLIASSNNSAQALFIALLLRSLYSLSGYIKVNDGILKANNKILVLSFPSNRFNVFEWNELEVVRKNKTLYLRKQLIFEFYSSYEND